MKRLITLLLILFSFNIYLMAQDETEEATPVVDDGNKPVRSPFETSTLIDFPTTVIPAAGSLQLLIHHRFGTMDKGISDIYGIYAPSNINMSLEYSATDYLQFGISTEKNNKIQEIHGKMNVFTQNRSGSVPVTVSLFSSLAVDARNKDNFGINYNFKNRLIMFEQLLISRKFNDRLSLLTGASYSHFNSAAEGVKHDHVGVHFGGRCKLWSANSFIFEYTYPFKIVSSDEANPPKPGFSAGLEFGTSTHGFQVFASNYQDINQALNVSKNQKDFFAGDILLGFNITVRF